MNLAEKILVVYILTNILLYAVLWVRATNKIGRPPWEAGMTKMQYLVYHLRGGHSVVHRGKPYRFDFRRAVIITLFTLPLFFIEQAHEALERWI